MFKKFLPHIVAFLFLAGFVAYAWTEPSSIPPGGNVPAPVNVGSASQYKSGALGIGGVFQAFSDVCIGGVCKNVWPAEGLGGSGIVNYISKFTGASSLGNSQIFDNGNNIGIGTASPGYKLEVMGQIRASQGTAIYSCPSVGACDGYADYEVAYHTCGINGQNRLSLYPTCTAFRTPDGMDCSYAIKTYNCALIGRIVAP